MINIHLVKIIEYENRSYIRLDYNSDTDTIILETVDKVVDVESLLNREGVEYITGERGTELYSIEGDFISSRQSININNLYNSPQGRGNDSFEHWVITQYSGYGITPLAVPRIFPPIATIRRATASKVAAGEFFLVDRIPVVSFFTPSPSSVLEDCCILATGADIVVNKSFFNVISSEGDENYFYNLWSGNLPVIEFTVTGTLTSINAVVIDVLVRDKEGGIWPYDFELFIENVNGQVSHNRATLLNGEARFKVYAPLLSAGDYIKIKVGTKFFKGLNEIILNVEE